MRVVSENSEADLAKRVALEDVRWALRELVANGMRVTRGAGKPYLLIGQADGFLQAVERYREVTSLHPSDYELARALDIGRAEIGSRGEYRPLSDSEHAFDRMMRGGLQMAASMLLFQNTQQRAGETELVAGIRERADAIQAHKKAWDKANPPLPVGRPRKPKA